MANQLKTGLAPVTIFNVAAGSLVDGAMSAATVTLLTATNVSSFWLTDLELTVTASLAMTQDSVISVHQRLHNLDGTSDEPVLSLANSGVVVGGFRMAAVTSQVVRLGEGPIALPTLLNGEEVEYQILNGSGQTLTNYKLTAKPFTPSYV